MGVVGVAAQRACPPARLPGDPGQKSVVSCLRSWNLPPATHSLAWRPPSPWGPCRWIGHRLEARRLCLSLRPAETQVCGDGQSLGFCVPPSISCYQLNVHFNKIVYISPKVVTQKKKRAGLRPVNI